MIDARTAPSGKKRTGVSFRLALPLGQLALCALILWPTRGYIFYELGLPAWTQGTPWLIQFGGPAMAAFASWSQGDGLRTVGAINLPAGIIHISYAIFSTDHSFWAPGHVDSRVWQAITWPILGMVFWWIAGRGVDALIAPRTRRIAPRVGWTETIIGFLLAAGGSLLVIGFLFTAGALRGNHNMQVLTALAGMWASFGAVTVAARFVQWRMRAALSQESNAEARQGRD